DTRRADTWCAPGVELRVPPMVVVPPVKAIAPRPDRLLEAPSVIVCVPPPNATAAPVPAAKVPVLVPPPPKLNVPLLPLTVPVLLKAMSTEAMPAPALLVKVPVAPLLNTGDPPKFAML